MLVRASGGDVALVTGFFKVRIVNGIVAMMCGAVAPSSEFVAKVFRIMGFGYNHFISDMYA